VYDPIGRMVALRTVNWNTGKAQLSLNGMAQGSYLLRILAANGKPLGHLRITLEE